MIILHGKEKKNMTAEELDALIAQFSRVVIDVGTGDGKNVYKSAKGAPDTLYIGLDAAAENMTDTAKKLMKKPEKGGLANCLLVVGTAENPPIELQGKADELTVYFPWGTLLQGVACAQEEMLSKLRDGVPVIELASKPGGIDPVGAIRHGTRVISAQSLPGRVAPVTAGKIIARCMIDKMSGGGI